MGDSLTGVVCGTIGAGAVGSYGIRLQRKEGADVLVYDVNQKRAQQVAEDFGGRAVSLDELLTNSDWTSVAVLPLAELFNVMRQIKERKDLLKPGSLLLDHSGVKTGMKSSLDMMLSGAGVKEADTFATATIKAVEGRNDVEAISIHLAFRPDVELEGQNVYVSPLKPTEGGLWLPRITQLLKSYKANVYQMTPEQQDLVTFRHQMIPWLALLAAFEAIRRSGSDMSFPEMEMFTTKLSKPFYDLMKRMTSGNWQVYWDTMNHHPASRRAAGLLEENMQGLFSQLVNGESKGFEAMYKHLQAIAASSSPERKTGTPIMAEIYYDRSQLNLMRDMLRLPDLASRRFYGDVSVSMIDAGRINELKKVRIPVARFTVHAYKDRTRQPEIAFYVRDVPHPEHPERSGMRFSSRAPRNEARSEQINPDYTRVQIRRLHPDPIVNFFANVKQAPALSTLGQFVVHKPL